MEKSLIESRFRRVSVTLLSAWALCGVDPAAGQQDYGARLGQRLGDNMLTGTPHQRNRNSGIGRNSRGRRVAGCEQMDNIDEQIAADLHSI